MTNQGVTLPFLCKGWEWHTRLHSSLLRPCWGSFALLCPSWLRGILSNLHLGQVTLKSSPVLPASGLRSVLFVEKFGLPDSWSPSDCFCCLSSLNLLTPKRLHLIQLGKLQFSFQSIQFHYPWRDMFSLLLSRYTTGQKFGHTFWFNGFSLFSWLLTL